MAFGNELRDGALMQGARDQQHNVVNHITVSIDQRMKMNGII
jgi:hypothetical protein